MNKKLPAADREIRLVPVDYKYPQFAGADGKMRPYRLKYAEMKDGCKRFQRAIRGFQSEPLGFQIYENISLGTPVSPIFESEIQVQQYAVDNCPFIGGWKSNMKDWLDIIMLSRKANEHNEDKAENKAGIAAEITAKTK